MKTNFGRILILSALLIGLSGCTYAVKYEGSLRGKVINSETEEPIRGAVVLALWHTSIDWLTHSPRDFYDAHEVETDENGEFMLPGKGLRAMSNLEPMEPVVYKAGYLERSLGGWENKFQNRSFGMKPIIWDGKKFIIPMQKLTMEERRQGKGLNSNSDVGYAPYEKVKLYIREINRERAAIGFKLIKPWGGNEK